MRAVRISRNMIYRAQKGVYAGRANTIQDLKYCGTLMPPRK